MRKPDLSNLTREQVEHLLYLNEGAVMVMQDALGRMIADLRNADLDKRQRSVINQHVGFIREQFAELKDGVHATIFPSNAA